MIGKYDLRLSTSRPGVKLLCQLNFFLLIHLVFVCKPVSFQLLSLVNTVKSRLMGSAVLMLWANGTISHVNKFWCCLPEKGGGS